MWNAPSFIKKEKPMISPKMVQAINEQINFEIYSSYLYLAMTGYFHDRDMPGAANWMRIQAQEELLHATMMFNYLVEREGRAHMAALNGPENEWASPLDAFEKALEHERIVTGRINALMSLALSEADHATAQFYQWFVKEQVEEEAKAKAIVQQLRLAGRDGQGLLLIDRDLATRVFVMPAGVVI